MLPMDHLGDDYKVLNRVPYSSQVANLGVGIFDLNISLSDNDNPVMLMAVVDTETTGLDTKRDEIIELGIITVGINKDGEICRLVRLLNMLQEPSKPLEPIITEVTGLTDAELKGHRIDVEQVAVFMTGVDMIAAHNAAFDRPFFDRCIYPTVVPWVCTSRGGEIDWKQFGHDSSKLETILHKQGFFYDAHRASVDCMATAWALSWEPEALAMLFERAKMPTYEIRAIGSPFSVKDELKANQFMWDAPNKVWVKTVVGAEARQQTLEFINEVYGGAKFAKVIEHSPMNKYRA